jgi:hypothetical protein
LWGCLYIIVVVVVVVVVVVFGQIEIGRTALVSVYNKMMLCKIMVTQCADRALITLVTDALNSVGRSVIWCVISLKIYC